MHKQDNWKLVLKFKMQGWNIWYYYMNNNVKITTFLHCFAIFFVTYYAPKVSYFFIHKNTFSKFQANHITQSVLKTTEEDEKRRWYRGCLLQTEGVGAERDLCVGWLLPDDDRLYTMSAGCQRCKILHPQPLEQCGPRSRTVTDTFMQLLSFDLPAAYVHSLKTFLYNSLA